jgi:hypothetical protein
MPNSATWAFMALNELAGAGSLPLVLAVVRSSMLLSRMSEELRLVVALCA